MAPSSAVIDAVIRQRDPVLHRRLEDVALDDAADLFRDVVMRIRPHQGRVYFHQRRILLDDHAHAVSSGLGLRSFARYVVRGLVSSSASIA